MDVCDGLEGDGGMGDSVMDMCDGLEGDGGIRRQCDGYV